MNQYIITDEKLQQLMTRKRKNPLGEGHGSDLSLADWEIHTIVDEVYHHPYQSERDKVLELLRLKYVEFLNHPCPELADKYDHCCDADWCGLCTLDEVLAELRQAGEP
jgi:hypothetical protein